MHNLLENGTFLNLGAGTFIGGNVGGTAAGVLNAGAFEYVTAAFFGTLANTGTINVYAVSNTGGSSPRVLASLTVGSSNNAGAAIEVKASALGTFINTGTTYSYLAAAGTVDSGGTWRGALVMLGYNARTMPVSNGLSWGSRYV